MQLEVPGGYLCPRWYIIPFQMKHEKEIAAIARQHKKEGAAAAKTHGQEELEVSAHGCIFSFTII
jgi:hypothetical protein